jgi:peptidoglycan/LPS O-acetylase OafA/YrhL
MNNSIANKASSKNGLIELFRFLCSVWVAYFHGFFPVLSDKFNGENISVDFFFMVTGLFFLKSVEKYIEKPLGEGVLFLSWGKVKRFAVPLAIAALSILYCNIAFPLEFNGFNWPLSFLWFFYNSNRIKNCNQFVFVHISFSPTNNK